MIVAAVLERLKNKPAAKKMITKLAKYINEFLIAPRVPSLANARILLFFVVCEGEVKIGDCAKGTGICLGSGRILIRGTSKQFRRKRSREVGGV
jgi:hypothetical protein